MMALGAKILFADDDPEIREVVRVLLESEGFRVEEAADGVQALVKVDKTVDLIILDVMMPGLSGIEACAEIRRKTLAPILFLTAKTQDADKLQAFSAGGDDFMAKPFSYTELTARIKAMLRRYHTYQGKESPSGEGVLRIRELEIWLEHREVRKNGNRIDCTDLEYRLLVLLAQNRGELLTPQRIYETVWKEVYYPQSGNTVMVHIRNLRKKLENDPLYPKYIVNVWGRGYRFG